MRLKDKVAIITGAGSGAGRTGTLIFSKEGAKVVVGDIDSEGGKETVKMIKNRGDKALWFRMIT
jgi:NAD(P)-dependent dehydrogenase (short-subunit alcohol dehydrogenase family)